MTQRGNHDRSNLLANDWRFADRFRVSCFAETSRPATALARPTRSTTAKAATATTAEAIPTQRITLIAFDVSEAGTRCILSRRARGSVVGRLSREPGSRRCSPMPPASPLVSFFVKGVSMFRFLILFAVVVACCRPSLSLAQDTPPELLRLDVQATAEVEEHSICLIRVDTNARDIQVKVKPSLFETVPVLELKKPGHYAFTGKPAEYWVWVQVFDPDLGIADFEGKVSIISKEPKPDPPKDPPTTGGFGLAAKVPAWIESVPESARGKRSAVKQTMLDIASKADQFKTVEEMLSIFGAAMLQVLGSDREAWSTFGTSWNSEIVALIKSGKISTTSDYAAALKEVGGAL